MSTGVLREDDDLHLNTIEQACLRFERAWGEQGHPELLDFLGDLSGEARRHALCDLLWIEWDQLRRRGSVPNLAEYRSRFADLAEVVDEAWRSDFRRQLSGVDAPQVRGGRYKLIKSHARGGFGQVYVAEDEEIGRYVAVKEIQFRHAQNKATQERFLREAKITGKLEHPGIVPVYSVGTKPDGTPFYAMRFVQGESFQAAIRQFHLRHSPVGSAEVEPPSGASSSSLEPDSHASGAESRASRTDDGEDPPRASGVLAPLPREAFRSRAFRQLLGHFVYVCKVMEYAHSRGVLHRDLKPANIILGAHGETLVVDWGLAKDAEDAEPLELPGGEPTAGPERASLTRFTRTTHGALIGTPSYMSPEQAAGKLADLTRRSDIYSLGATLYHLLVGRPPLADVAQEELLIQIQRGDIPQPRQLQPALPAALNAICRQAMSLDPDDRYTSAASLADDLEHWLAGDSVEAYREPWRERLGRWARNHQTATVSAVVALFLLAISSAAVAVLVSIHNRNLAVAEAKAVEQGQAALAAKSTAEAAQREAETERDLSQYIANFMVETFRSPDPEVDGRGMTVSELLDRAFLQLKGNDQLPPSVKARLLTTLITTHWGLGLYEDAIDVGEYASSFATTHLGEDHVQTLDVHTAINAAYIAANKLPQAIQHCERTLHKSKVIHGESHMATLTRAVQLAAAYDAAGRYNDALRVATHAYRDISAQHNEHTSELINARFTLGAILINLERPEEALPHLEFASNQGRLLRGLDNPDTRRADNALATAHAALGDYNRAINLHLEVVSSRKLSLGENHPYTLNSLNNLAIAYSTAGDFRQAIELHESLITKRREVLGTFHRSTLASISNAGECYSDAGEVERAIPLLEEACRLQEEHFGTSDDSTLKSKCRLAKALLSAGRVGDCIQLIEGLENTLTESLGETHPFVTASQNLLAQAYRRAGDSFAAVNIYRRLLPVEIGRHGESHPTILMLLNNLATSLATANKFDEAIAMYLDCIKRQEHVFGDDHPATLQSKVNLAICYDRINSSEGIPILEGAIPAIVAKLGWKHPITLQSHLALAGMYRHQDRHEEAGTLYFTIEEQLASTLGPTHSQLLNIQRYIGGYLLERGEIDLGIKRLKQSADGLEQSLGKENMQTLAAIEDLAEAMRTNGRLGESEPYLLTLVKSSESRTIRDEDALATNLYWLANCLQGREAFAESEPYLRQCIALWTSNRPDYWRLPLAESLLGLCIAQRAEYESAERMLLQAHTSLQTLRDVIPPHEHEHAIDLAVGNIVILYELWNKPERSRWWREQGAIPPVR